MTYLSRLSVKWMFNSGLCSALSELLYSRSAWGSGKEDFCIEFTPKVDKK